MLPSMACPCLDRDICDLMWATLHALVYDLLPSTTAVFSYAVGPRKLSANEQLFDGAQLVVSLLQTTQNHTWRLFCNCVTMLLTPAQIKPESFESRRNVFFFSFLPGVDASHVYVRAWELDCFHSLISTRTPSIAFRHLPPNSARLDIICPPTRSAPSERFVIRLWKQPSAKART